MSSVAMLYHGNDFHPAHRGFAESIDADVISVAEFAPQSGSYYEKFKAQYSLGSFCEEFKNGYTIDKYDTIISEGSRPLYAGLTHKLFHDSDLIYLCADHRLYEIWKNSTDVDSIYTLLKYLLGKYGKPAMRTVVQKGIDGIIAVSELVNSYLRPIFQDRVPTQVVHPYIQQDLFDSLGKVTPNLNQNVAVTVGRGRKYKGVDILVDAWPAVRKQHPNAELYVVGNNHPESYENTPGVSVLGFVEDVISAYSNAGLYVQPSRIEPFGVAVLEALRAGLPAVVTEQTGVRSEITEITDQLVAPATSEGLSKAISRYFSLSQKNKNELSGAARNRSDQFGPDRGKEMFYQGYTKLITKFEQ